MARKEKQIEGINDNNWYPTTYDKTHDISIAGSYDINKRFTASATRVYGTGNAVTSPNRKYNPDGQIVPYYSNRNVLSLLWAQHIK